ncbi:VOC family protein [Nonomuraea sediminis]|uniref:VOC family protein n=1 Tax=Nonomuraea sediminis TaxID=2835864 RepID=UPI001BDD8640|nr:VOC family protein [Nonomuraea sediminis]
MFVNIPVKDVNRSKQFFTDLGFDHFGATEDMASVIISDTTQVMLIAEPTFATFAEKQVGDPRESTQAILVLGLENPQEVDALLDKALAAGAAPVGEPTNADGRYLRGFRDLDGHHWAALCLIQP